MIFVPTRKIGETLQDLPSGSGFGDSILSFPARVRVGARAAGKKVRGRELPTCGSDHLYECIWYGARRSERTISYSLAAPVISRGLPSGVRSSGARRAAIRCCPSSLLILARGWNNDIGLLHFMARKSCRRVRNSMRLIEQRLSPTKYRQIEAIARLVGQDGCFRQTLVGYFAGSKANPRGSFSTRLLEWVFADRGMRRKKAACCDACCRRMIRQRGQLGFVQSALIS